MTEAGPAPAPGDADTAAAGAAARAARKRRLEEKAAAEAQQRACPDVDAAEAARLERIARKTAERRAAEAEERARLARLAQRAEERRQAKGSDAPPGTAAPSPEAVASAPTGAPGEGARCPAAAPQPAAAPAAPEPKERKEKAAAKKAGRKEQPAPTGAEIRAARKKRAERRAAGKPSSSTSSSSRRRRGRRKAAAGVPEEGAPCFAWERVERGLAPITTSFGSFGVSVTLQEIEVFLKECGYVEQQACQRFRGLPAHLQRAIMERGAIGGCDNPTAIMVSRINDAESGVICASATENLLDLIPQRKNDEIEKLIKERQLDHNCALKLRSLTPAQQKFALTIPLHECKNPSAFILANLANADMTSAGNVH
ncbi:unnamed protein product [Prorocentrum cordatum]|uniref:Uncharacterized protein n=1 Tax=Prorocentrum cordatum TaxID=2364126 RepID=A0ABN9SZU2_9DINO|nr:unnamed protein product [Polarella glacialis]